MNTTFRLLPALIFAVLVNACTSTTGTRVHLTETSLRDIKTLGVCVKTNEEFSVRLSRERMSNTGALMGGLIGASIEASVRSSNDKRLEKQLRSALGGFDAHPALAQRLQSQLAASGLFSSVQILNTDDRRAARSAGMDAVLEITIRQWGLVACEANQINEHLEVQCALHEQLISLADNRRLWERDEYYLDGDCRDSTEFEFRKNLLHEALEKAADNVAARTVNELRYPRTGAGGDSR